MKDKIKAHFQGYNPRKFVIFTVISLFVTDLVNCKFFQIYWKAKDFSTNLVHQTIAKSGQVIEDFSPSTIQEMMGFIDNSFYFLLFIIVVNNLFFYLFYLRRKLWAYGFIHFYVITGALLQLTFLFDYSGIDFIWLGYNFLLIPYYLYLFVAMKYLKHQTTGDFKIVEQ